MQPARRPAPIPSPTRVLAALGPDAGGIVVRDGPRSVVAITPEETVVASGAAALGAVESLTPGWWAGYLAYELGHAIERVVPRAAPGALDPSRALPDLVLARYASRLVLDPERGARVVGNGVTRARLLAALARAREPREPPLATPGLGPWRSSLAAGEFAGRVREIIELLRAGECYQVNLTRRLVCDRAAEPGTLFAALEARNPSPYGSIVGGAGVTVVSASPERFLRWHDGVVETRPIKGTGRAPGPLARSAKDRAENVMIVDLARNDLGRVCEPGSITVPELCAVERHPGLHHLVSTVRGRVLPEVDASALLRATFPPASVTGAPKPRVMQAIEDLEPVARGAYCGALGWIDTERGAGDLAVAIRSFTIAGGQTSVGVGAGIVADSQPGAEWRETELKAARILAAAGTSVASAQVPA